MYNSFSPQVFSAAGGCVLLQPSYTRDWPPPWSRRDHSGAYSNSSFASLKNIVSAFLGSFHSTGFNCWGKLRQHLARKRIANVSGRLNENELRQALQERRREKRRNRRPYSLPKTATLPHQRLMNSSKRHLLYFLC